MQQYQLKKIGEVIPERFMLLSRLSTPVPAMCYASPHPTFFVCCSMPLWLSDMGWVEVQPAGRTKENGQGIVGILCLLPRMKQ